MPTSRQESTFATHKPAATQDRDNSPWAFYFMMSMMGLGFLLLIVLAFLS